MNKCIYVCVCVENKSETFKLTVQIVKKRLYVLVAAILNHGIPTENVDVDGDEAWVGFVLHCDILSS